MVSVADDELPTQEAPTEEAAAPAAGPAEPSTPQEQVMALLETAKKNLPMIIGVVVLLAIIYVYLFVLPKPGTIMLNVYELDMGDKAFSDAEVDIIDAAGNVVANPILGDGTAVASGVPPGILTVKVKPSSAGYDTATGTIELKSGGSASVTVNIPKKADLIFKGTVSGQKIGSGCSKTFSIEVANNGEDVFDVELVAEEADLNNIFTYSGPQTIDSKSTATFTFTITAPSEGTEIPSGKIRAKYTNAKTDFSATSVEPPEMRVDPGEIDIRCPAGKCGDVQVTIRNDGKSDLSDLKLELGGGVTETDLDIVGFESKAIKPNGRTTFFVRGKAAGIGKVGKLRIVSGCSEEELPVSIKGD